MAKTIVGSFDSFDEAQEVLRDLQQLGFSRDDISVIANNATGQYSSTYAGGAQGAPIPLRQFPKRAPVPPPALLQVACWAARRGSSSA